MACMDLPSYLGATKKNEAATSEAIVVKNATDNLPE